MQADFSSSLISGVDLSSRVSVAVARKSLDVAESQGEAMVALIRAAGEVGKTIRATPRAPRGEIAPDPGPREPGRLIDLTA